jgi:hypothetical protein
MIVFYVVLIPAFVFYKYKKASQEKDEKTLKILINPLISTFRRGAEYFPLVRFFFQVCFVFARDAITFSPSGKIVVHMLLLFILVWVESYVKPYASNAHQGLSILYDTRYVILLTILAGGQ